MINIPSLLSEDNSILINQKLIDTDNTTYISTLSSTDNNTYNKIVQNDNITFLLLITTLLFLACVAGTFFTIAKVSNILKQFINFIHDEEERMKGDDI